MKYDEHQAAVKVWHAKLAEINAGRADHEWVLPESAEEMPHVIADVTCETNGCSHGTQRVLLIDWGTGEYHSHCGNCNTTNTLIVGHFEDGHRQLVAHIPEQVKRKELDYETRLSSAGGTLPTVPEAGN